MARVPDRESRRERVVLLLEIELRRDARNRVPVAVAHRDVDPPHELELAEPHVAEVDAVERRGQRACPYLAQHQIAVIPPSADQTAPVVYAVRSEARNAITSATSSGSPARRSGIVSSSASCSAGVTHSVIGVVV